MTTTPCMACSAEESANELRGIEGGTHAAIFLHGIIVGQNGTPVLCKLHAEGLLMFERAVEFLEMSPT